VLNFIVALIISLFCCLSLPGCDSNQFTSPVKPVKAEQKKKKLSKLEQIKHKGVLRVLTRTAPSTYYPVAKNHAGLEYDLVTLFAKELGIKKIEFYTAKTMTEILDKTAAGEFDIAAAGLAITESRKQKLRFATAYHDIVEQVIYRSGTPRPKTLLDLNAGILEVLKDSSHVETLQSLQKTSAPQLIWQTNAEFDSNSLISLLDQGLIDYTVTDSTQALLLQRFYPELHIAFDIGQTREMAWGLPKSNDDSLYNAVNQFFHKIKQDKTLDQLLERYYGHVGSLDYVDKCKFYQHQQERLPLYKPYFVKAAKEHNLDWRLLAAIGYQESHWEDSAISPTGVRGIMMLTNDTALQVGVQDRTDPVQSIQGGAFYFLQQLQKIPSRISEPDRTWFALAAYNIGYGHLEDARILARQQNLNPDKWLDVKKTLPLLAQESWFPQTKHGYARGEEPIAYVENVRNYYDLLVWITNQNNQKAEKTTLSTKTSSSSFTEQLKDFYQEIVAFFASTKNWFELQKQAIPI
jgi:membrane-bound lytic murein transglycosylase F